MKLTVELLKKLNACEEGIAKFKNTIKLHDIHIDKPFEIETSDEELLENILWLRSELKSEFKLRRIKYNRPSDNYWEEYTYDSNGNELTYKVSSGYLEKFSYDDSGNELTHENPIIYWEEKTYDKCGNLLTKKKSNGYYEEHTYDDNGNELTCKTLHDDYWEERTYDKDGIILTYKNSNDKYIDYSKLTYDMSKFVLKYYDYE